MLLLLGREEEHYNALQSESEGFSLSGSEAGNLQQHFVNG